MMGMERFEDQVRRVAATLRITTLDDMAVAVTLHFLTVTPHFQMRNVILPATSAIINLLDRAQGMDTFLKQTEFNERRKKTHPTTLREKEQMTNARL